MIGLSRLIGLLGLAVPSPLPALRVFVPGRPPALRALSCELSILHADPLRRVNRRLPVRRSSPIPRARDG
jgi:hypothetical protein